MSFIKNNEYLPTKNAWQSCWASILHFEIARPLILRKCGKNCESGTGQVSASLILLLTTLQYERIIMSRQKVLFICAHNAARSQMAEGYLRARYGDRYDAFSAGTRSSTVSRYAIEVMGEIGIDISSQISKSLNVFYGEEMDFAVILCEEENGVCPVFPWAKQTAQVHFTNPAKFTGNEEEVRTQFRGVRDEITQWIDEFFGKVTND
jgi:arsenate reductase